MTHNTPANPTAMSAVVGEELSVGEGATPGAVLVKSLVMPAVLAAFAAYLLIGIFTMRVPEGTMFPGPQFFPAIITAGLFLFAALLAIRAVKEWRASASQLAAGTRHLELDPDVDQGAGADPGIDLVPESAPTQVRVDWASLAWVVGGFVAFTLLLPWLGWIIGAAFLFWCIARGFGARRPVFTILVGLTTSSLAYILFDMLLGLSLPSGILGWGF